MERDIRIQSAQPSQCCRTTSHVCQPAMLRSMLILLCAAKVLHSPTHAMHPQLLFTCAASMPSGNFLPVSLAGLLAPTEGVAGEDDPESAPAGRDQCPEGVSERLHLQQMRAVCMSFCSACTVCMVSPCIFWARKGSERRRNVEGWASAKRATSGKLAGQGRR